MTDQIPQGPRAQYEAMRAEVRKRFLKDPHYREPNWVAMYERLLDILPGAATTISFPGYLQPDGILKAAVTAGVPHDSFFIYNPWRMKSNGYGDKRWEDYDDTEVLDLLLKKYPLPPAMGLSALQGIDALHRLPIRFL